MPFAYAEHSLYVVQASRAPKTHMTAKKMQKYLQLLHDSEGDKIKIDRVRVFAQLWMLGPGDALQNT